MQSAKAVTGLRSYIFDIDYPNDQTVLLYKEIAMKTYWPCFYSNWYVISSQEVVSVTVIAWQLEFTIVSPREEPDMTLRTGTVCNQITVINACCYYKLVYSNKSCIAWSLVSPQQAFEALKYLQALQRYNSDIQAHLLNSEIRQVVHRNLKHGSQWFIIPSPRA